MCLIFFFPATYLTGNNFPSAETAARGGKRARGGRARLVRPCPHLSDIKLWRAGGLSRAARCDFAEATVAELWPAGCRQQSLITSQLHGM